VRYLGLGFLCTQRRVYDDVQRTFSLPFCNLRFGAAVVPYFLPMVIEDDARPGGYWYLGEDYAFLRARAAGRPRRHGRHRDAGSATSDHIATAGRTPCSRSNASPA